MKLKEEQLSKLKSTIKQRSKDIALAQQDITQLNETSAQNMQKLKANKEELERLETMPQDCRVFELPVIDRTLTQLWWKLGDLVVFVHCLQRQMRSGQATSKQKCAPKCNQWRC